MIISVINHTRIPDHEVQAVVRAVNRQVTEDFEPYWSLGATLRLEGKSTKLPDKVDLRDMRGDAVLYLWDEDDVDDAVGYHDKNNRGIPYGFVFTELAKELGEPWSVTFSHEALEMIADPEVNLLVQGPHPTKKGQHVFYWYEMCDAVQAETYSLDGVAVSNFVLPLYFTGGEQGGCRNDFLGRTHAPAPGKKEKPLVSFGLNPGGYAGFFDPGTGEHEQVVRDDEAARRLRIRGRFGASRRSVRHQRFVDGRKRAALTGADGCPVDAPPSYVPCPGARLVRARPR